MGSSTAFADLAVLFPGQGSERKGMGARLAARCSEARGLRDQVSTLGEVDAHRLIAQGGSDWRRTEVLQPLLVAVCLGFFAALKKIGLRPRAVAGHSLGELTAWAAAGCVSSSDAVRLAAIRGKLMAHEAKRSKGGLLALVDCDEAVAREAIALGSAHGNVALAGRNAPSQWVLSGDAAVLRLIAARYRSRPLSALGPWHSAAMAPATEAFQSALAATSQSPPQCQFVAGGSGKLLSGSEIPRGLSEQLSSPFRWDRAMYKLRQLGIRRFVTVGPAKVLRQLIRDNLGDGADIFAIEDVDDVDSVAARLEP